MISIFSFCFLVLGGFLAIINLSACQLWFFSGLIMRSQILRSKGFFFYVLDTHPQTVHTQVTLEVR